MVLPTLLQHELQTLAKDYALVISDVRMPKINGFEFAARKPDAKIVLMSAF
ncbi:MAG TPA: hypothetical protein VGQ13_03985 [Nitrososphaera sp.]|jgi:YesN/AraC family two-component response regulator|nr:hypothetical protein [Nitrososphaera sp.]